MQRTTRTPTSDDTVRSVRNPSTSRKTQMRTLLKMTKMMMMMRTLIINVSYAKKKVNLSPAVIYGLVKGLATLFLWINYLPFSRPASKKRFKKDHGRTWKHEEKKRSGEQRRGRVVQNVRRGSGSRQRDWNSDESEEDSPPPSLNDGDLSFFFLQIHWENTQKTDGHKSCFHIWLISCCLPLCSVAKKLKKREKQKIRKSYEAKMSLEGMFFISL